MCKLGAFESLIRIFKSSVNAVLPEALIKNSVKYNASTEQLKILEHTYSLKDKNVYVVGAGKAVKNMALELENIMGSKIKDGYISIPVGSHFHKDRSGKLQYFEGAKNNLPDSEAENAAKKVRSLISNFGANDFLLVLISGGGSALLPLPKPPITLAEKTQLIKRLANSGADIMELNTVRKKISDLKGGQLALKAQPAQIATLILSDIVGDPLDLIASGPTVENKDPLTAALDILKKYKLLQDLPYSIKNVTQSYNLSDTFPHENVKNYIIGSNKLSIEAATSQAEKLGYMPIVLSHTITGNVKDVAKEYYKLCELFCNYNFGRINYEALKTGLESLKLSLAHNNLSILKSDCISELCLILGGETTVEVKGSGKGGRNQQLALEFSVLLHENKEHFLNNDIFFLSAGTDGIDGPTDAAGGMGYVNLVSDSVLEDLDIHQYLKNNDSYNFYRQFQNGKLHIKTGHTNTNVMDIHLILIKKC